MIRVFVEGGKVKFANYSKNMMKAIRDAFKPNSKMACEKDQEQGWNPIPFDPREALK